MPRVGIVIPAGGVGRRFGRGTPKQFLLLGGKPVLAHSIALCESLPQLHEIVVVSPEDFLTRTKRLVERSGFRKVIRVVAGGRERQESVWNGLNAFAVPPEIVLVHDGVRPFASRAMMKEVIQQTIKHGAAVVGIPVKDTIKAGRRGFYSHTLDRSNLWVVQTPQGFLFELLWRAHIAARNRGFLGTDEASLVERLKKPVRIVNGSPTNIKITTKEDLQLAKMLLKTGKRRGN